jgi:hypothetical protein
MNAFPMVARCATHQWLFHLLFHCVCGEPIPGGKFRCATCALKGEIAWAASRGW